MIILLYYYEFQVDLCDQFIYISSVLPHWHWDSHKIVPVKISAFTKGCSLILTLILIQEDQLVQLFLLTLLLILSRKINPDPSWISWAQMGEVPINPKVTDTFIVYT